jgi:hypothetical protein
MTSQKLDALSVACLGAAVVVRIFGEIWYSPLLITLLGALFLIFILLQFRRLSVAPRIYLAFCVALFLWAVFFGECEPQMVLQAIENGGFLVTLLVSASILRAAAETSPLVQKCGSIVVNQPPGRRYLVLALAGNLFGFFLSVGAINVLGAMAYKSIHGRWSESASSEALRIANVRLRRMGQAIVRGFASTPLWSPMSVPIAMIMSAHPEQSWMAIARVGIAVAGVSLIFGWILDKIQNPRLKTGVNPDELTVAETAASFARLLAFVMLVPALGYGVAKLLEISFIFGVLACMPPISFAWFVFQTRRDPSPPAVSAAGRRFGQSIGQALTGIQSEVAIFVCAGFLSVMLTPQLNVTYLGTLVSKYGATEGLVLALVAWLILLLACLGLNIVFLVAFFTEFMSALPGLNITSGLSAIALTASFAVAIGVAPLSIPIRLTAVCVRRSPIEVGIRWNGLYSVVIMVTLSSYLICAGR